MEETYLKVLLMDHNQKVKDQDHQRANFPDKMEKDKVKILDLLKVKMEKQIQYPNFNTPC